MLTGGPQQVNILHNFNRSKSMNIFKTPTRREQSLAVRPCHYPAARSTIFNSIIFKWEYLHHEYTNKRHQ